MGQQAEDLLIDISGTNPGTPEEGQLWAVTTDIRAYIDSQVVSLARPSLLDTASDIAVDTTTSTAFQDKVTLTTTQDYVPGEYWIEVSYGWNHDNAGNDFLAQVLVDGTIQGQIHQQEPKDPQGTFGATGTNQRYYCFRRIPWTVAATVASGTDIVLQYSTTNAGVESSIWEAIIAVYRVS